MKKSEKVYYLLVFFIFFVIVNIFSFYRINSLIGASIFDHKKYLTIKANFVKNNKGTLPHPFLGSTSTKLISLDSTISNEPMFHSVSKNQPQRKK